MINFEFLKLILFNLRYQMDKEFGSKFTLEQQVWLIVQLQCKDVKVLFVNDEGFDILNVNCHDVDHCI